MRALTIALFAFATSAAQFEIPQKGVLIDEVIPVVVSGLPPNSNVTIRARSEEWASSATFVADANGVMTAGDPMRLFWSAERTSSRPTNSDVWTLSAEVEGKTVATTTITRRAVAPDVKITRVRERGLVGEFYQPPGEGKHPAVLVLGGSGGGLPPASGHPGGLSSRGYAVLSLAYFAEEGLPRSLQYIPLEYFDKAIAWLASQPSVDPSRIAVLGTSRGGELALLLGSIIPRIKMVVAYVPSNVVVAGCCDGRGEPSWTIGGRAVAYVRPRFDNDAATHERATIQVEKTRGAILLISGRDDAVWASSSMSQEIVARLERNHFAYPYKHLTYDHAGHAIGRPFTSTMEINSTRHPITGRVLPFGGTPEGTARARADSWVQMLEFLKANL
jgi:dienelactone hydrolase